MKKYLSLLIVLFLFETSFSQVSGYLGKKFSVIYSVGTSLPHFSKENGEKMIVNPILKQAISLEYVTSNRTAIRFRYQLAMVASKNFTENYIYNDFVSHHKFYGHTYGVSVKLYTRNSIAPLGNYFSFSTNFQNLIVKDFIAKDENYLNKYNSSYNSYDVVFNFGIGRNLIFNDIFIVGIEAEAGLPFLSFVIRANSGFGESTSSDSFGNIGYSINFPSEFLKISLNLGLLAF